MTIVARSVAGGASYNEVSPMSVLARMNLPLRLVVFALLFSASLTSKAADQATLKLGRSLFTAEASPPCAVCHTLADAGASGSIGPDLDALKPSAERVTTAVRGGIGVMPAFEALTEEQVSAIALYVSTVAGSR